MGSFMVVVSYLKANRCHGQCSGFWAGPRAQSLLGELLPVWVLTLLAPWAVEGTAPHYSL